MRISTAELFAKLCEFVSADFRLKVCVHSPDAHFQCGVRLWHTLAQFLHLVGVNAVSSRV